MTRQRILFLLGTRPEAIKLAPVIREVRSRTEGFDVCVCSSGQHREMLSQALEPFDIRPDIQFDAMASAHSLGRLTGRLFKDVDRLLETEAPDWLIVQGDTTSAMVGAVCAFYRRIKVGHVEAGLRTDNRWSPFPEEINRTFIGHVADMHFAPTKRAAQNLRKAGVDESAICITGNTVVDALQLVIALNQQQAPLDLTLELGGLINGGRLVLATSHRRESFGLGLENICQALLRTAETYEDVLIVYPVHLNPKVKEPVHRLLGRHPRIKLISPVGYQQLVWLMQRSYCILTDSGGIQEEAPALGKPVLVMRDTTERPEAIEAGCARLVGTNVNQILAGVRDLFENPAIYEAMAQVQNPFGDGLASQRIAELLEGKKVAPWA